jgi:hypothetical protein
MSSSGAVHAQLTEEERDRAVTDLIDLVGAVDGIVQAQATQDAGYFIRLCDRRFSEDAQRQVGEVILRAYRWQYIVSGVEHPHFARLLAELTSPAQLRRIQVALYPIVSS